MSDLNWTIPVMRAGYAGRGITYLAVASLSLWAISRGGDAKGTSSALDTLSETALGVIALWLIALGLFAYALWRGIGAAEDLEDQGSDAKGLLSRAGMIVTGLIHGALGALALSFALGLPAKGDGGSVARFVGSILSWPGGPWLISVGGAATIGAGLYYVRKGWKATYRDSLAANHFTTHWDWALRAGVMAQGLVITIVGGLMLTAGLTANAQQAGGMDKAFDWIAAQPFGKAVVVAVCLGLLAFGFFCFVNAAYRIVPKVDGDGMETLRAKLQDAT